MTEQLTLTLLTLICTLPILLIFKEDKVNCIRIIGLASLYHVIYVALIFLPIINSYFSIADSTQNWIGKLLAFIFSIGFYFITKRYFKECDYILSLPTKGTLKKMLIAGLITVVSMSALTVAFSASKVLSLEVLLYQITMPGLDEELWRGILLGLLISVLGDRKYKLGHPALWITTLIFALGHSLYLPGWKLGFALDAFIITGILGYVLGWMTYYSKSILPAIILHNFINFSTNSLEMLIL